MGPHLELLYQQLSDARDNEKRSAEKFTELEWVMAEQKGRLEKYEELQQKWTEAARLDEIKMRDLHQRIQQLEDLPNQQ